MGAIAELVVVIKEKEREREGGEKERLGLHNEGDEINKPLLGSSS